MGKSPRDALDLGLFWEGWSGATTPEVSTQLVISGRDGREEELAVWLKEGSASTFGLKGESPDDSLAFLAATVHRMSEAQRERQLSRSVLVSDPATWRELAESKAPLVLVPRFDAEGMVAGATSHGHQVFVPMGTEHAVVGRAVELARLGRDAAREARARGFTCKPRSF